MFLEYLRYIAMLQSCDKVDPVLGSFRRPDKTFYNDQWIERITSFKQAPAPIIRTLIWFVGVMHVIIVVFRFCDFLHESSTF